MADGRLFRGILTGLTEAYTIDTPTREKLVHNDPGCAELIKPFLRGSDILPWEAGDPGLWLIAIPSSGDRHWPWSDSGDDAESIFASTYPSLHAHLARFQPRLEKRSDKGQFWWELRSCGYWNAFEETKVIWPDIAKLPRFVFDQQQRYVSNTSYFVSGVDAFVFGILTSWATWFLISKTAQPLRLRGDRWQYRLFTQYMQELPIPPAPEPERNAIGETALRAAEYARELYELRTKTQNRLISTFRPPGDAEGKLNQAAERWWKCTFRELGVALKKSFKLPSDPFKNPRTADDWEPYIAEKQQQADALQRQIRDAEAELNNRVYRLFDLTPDEIELLQREVEH